MSIPVLFWMRPKDITFEYNNKASILWLLTAIFWSILTVVFLIFTFIDSSTWLLSTVLAVMFGLFAAFFFFAWRTTKGVHRLVLDGMGIHYSVSNELRWEVLWGEVRELAAFTTGQDNIIHNILLKTDTIDRSLNSMSDFSSLEQLRSIFVEIAKRADGPFVVLKDKVGWSGSANSAASKSPR